MTSFAKPLFTSKMFFKYLSLLGLRRLRMMTRSSAPMTSCSIDAGGSLRGDTWSMSTTPRFDELSLPEMDANDKTTMTSLSDVDYDEDDILGSDVLKRRRLFDDDDDAAAYDDDDDRRSSDANEETFCDGDNGFDDDDDDDEEEGGGEEVEGQLSEYWDQVNDKHLLDLK